MGTRCNNGCLYFWIHGPSSFESCSLSSYGDDRAISWNLVVPFIIAQVLGAFAGAILVWLSYLPHWNATKDESAILGTFATGPAIRNYPANVITELIGTFVLVLGLLAFGQNEFAPGTNVFAVGGLILAIGLSLGGPTGYAINPARDFGPRLAHAVLPIANKGTSDWAYSWVPIAGPMIEQLSR